MSEWTKFIPGDVKLSAFKNVSQAWVCSKDHTVNMRAETTGRYDMYAAWRHGSNKTFIPPIEAFPTPPVIEAQIATNLLEFDPDDLIDEVVPALTTIQEDIGKPALQVVSTEESVIYHPHRIKAMLLDEQLINGQARYNDLVKYAQETAKTVFTGPMSGEAALILFKNYRSDDAENGRQYSATYIKDDGTIFALNTKFHITNYGDNNDDLTRLGIFMGEAYSHLSRVTTEENALMGAMLVADEAVATGKSKLTKHDVTGVIKDLRRKYPPIKSGYFNIDEETAAQDTGLDYSLPLAIPGL